MTRDGLRRRKPDIIVVSSNALYRRSDSEKLGDERADAYISDLLDGRTNYEIAARLRTGVPFHRNNRFAWDVHSRISPTIIILPRGEERERCSPSLQYIESSAFSGRHFACRCFLHCSELRRV